jgi:hypothetical protein
VSRKVEDIVSRPTTFSAAETMSNKCNIVPIRRPRILPNRLAYSVVEETVGHPPQVDTQMAFRQHIYFPICLLDCIIPELDIRFFKTRDHSNDLHASIDA